MSQTNKTLTGKNTFKEGYIPISRQLFEHPLWKEERIFSYAEAWIDLIQMARFDTTPGTFLHRNQMINFHRGELVTSFRMLGNKWNWSTSKVGRYLDLLEKENMLRRETPNPGGVSVITLCNYDTYNSNPTLSTQNRGQQRNAGETQTKHKRDNTNKENKEKKEKEREPPAHTPEYQNFRKWMQQEVPYCADRSNFPKTITQENYFQLREKYSKQEITEVLLSIENRKDFRKRYCDLYTTVLKWLKIRAEHDNR